MSADQTGGASTEISQTTAARPQQEQPAENRGAGHEQSDKPRQGALLHARQRLLHALQHPATGNAINLSLAILALFGAGLVVWQTSLTRAALNDARKQYREGKADAEADAIESKRRFEAALQQQREAAAKQAGLMADSNRALRDTLATMQSNAAADQRLSGQALVQGRRFFGESQRAQLVVEKSKFFFNDTRRPTGGLFVIKNAGHAVATAVRSMTCFTAGPSGGSMDLKASVRLLPSGIAGIEPLDVMGPGQSRRLSDSLSHADMGFPIVDCPDFAKDGAALSQQLYFLFMRVQYCDGFGQERYLDNCIYWLEDLGAREPDISGTPCFRFVGDGTVADLAKELRFQGDQKQTTRCPGERYNHQP